LWDKRNCAEHEHDNEVLSATLNSEISNLIKKHHQKSDGPFHPSELNKLQSSHLAYKVAWILNVQAADDRILRKEENDTCLQGMRTVMRNFLNAQP
jgi:hypothetical protein